MDDWDEALKNAYCPNPKLLNAMAAVRSAVRSAVRACAFVDGYCSSPNGRKLDTTAITESYSTSPTRCLVVAEGDEIGFRVAATTKFYASNIKDDVANVEGFSIGIKIVAAAVAASSAPTPSIVAADGHATAVDLAFRLPVSNVVTEDGIGYFDFYPNPVFLGATTTGFRSSVGVSDLLVVKKIS